MPRHFLYLFVFIALYACFDLVFDYNEAEGLQHVIVDSIGTSITLAGVFVLAR